MKKFIYVAFLMCVLFSSTDIMTMHRAFQHPTAKARLARRMVYPSLLKKKKCANLICIFDSFDDESLFVENHAMMTALMMALREEFAPIIITPNILEHFCYWKVHHAEVMQNSNLRLYYSLIIATSFNDNDWHCYAHKNAGLMLLIPKKYIATHAENQAAAIQNQIEQCGFDVRNLDKISDVSPATVLNYIQEHKPQYIKLIDQCESMFIKNKDQLLYDLQWNVYLTGHGGNVNVTEVTTTEDLLRYKKYIVEEINKLELLIENPKPYGLSRELAKEFVERWKEILRHPTLELDIKRKGKGQVAGLPYADFVQLISFFEKDINTTYLHYVSCYSGGSNQALVNNELSQINARFIVSAQGVNESVTYGGSTVNTTMFTNFFTALETFFCDQTQQIIQGSLQKDPIARIVNAVISKELIDNTQPFVRIPEVGVFNALSVDKQVKFLTNAIERGHELEGTPIDYTDSAIKTIFIYPSYVSVPLKIKSHVAIVSPSPQREIKPTETIHVLEELFYNDTLCSMIPNFVSFNTRYEPILFVIKKLHCLDYGNSGLGVGIGKPIVIENMIIHISSSKDLGITTTTVIFTFNNVNYSFSQEVVKLQENIKKLFDAFMQASAAIVSQDYLNTLAEKIVGKQMIKERGDKEITLSFIIEELEKKVEKPVNVKKPGELKYALVLKKIDSLERAMSQEALSEQKKWLKRNNKPATFLVNSLKKLMHDATSVQQQINQLTVEDLSGSEVMPPTKEQADSNRDYLMSRVRKVMNMLNIEYAQAVAQLTWAEYAMTLMQPAVGLPYQGGGAAINRKRQADPLLEMKFRKPR